MSGLPVSLGEIFHTKIRLEPNYLQTIRLQTQLQIKLINTNQSFNI